MNKLTWLGAIVLISAFVVGCNGLDKNADENKSDASQTNAAPVVEEVVVESNLNVRKKPATARQRRNAIYIYPVNELVLTAHNRKKRQFQGLPNFGQSSSQANAFANANQFGPQGFDASQAQAQAQGFNSQGPLGGFGANAAGASSNNLHLGPDGIRGGASFSQGQNYDLPGGHKLSFNVANSFSVGPDGKPVKSNANTFMYS